MKIKTFEAADMRQGMRKIREELGEDAVLLATERTAMGVLLTAAIDFEAPKGTGAERSGDAAAAMRAVPSRERPGDGALSEELRVLRRLLETQMSQLAWNEYTRNSPVVAEVHRELQAAEFSDSLVRDVLAGLGEQAGYSAVRHMAMIRLADRVRVQGGRWLQFGGRIAMLGSPGAGKTTAALQLVARWVQRHGAGEAALVSADCLGFGTHEKLAAQARLLGVAAYAIDSAAQLPDVLARLKGHRLVLIDTAGIASPADMALARWRECSQSLPELECVLVACASAQARLHAAMLTDDRAPRWSSVLVTRLDESRAIGALLSCCIERGIPLSHVSRGRRWLQDLLPARAEELIADAVRANDRVDNELIAPRAEVA
jgi:flagellar biosynthesis protein FlhF